MHSPHSELIKFPPLASSEARMKYLVRNHKPGFRALGVEALRSRELARRAGAWGWGHCWPLQCGSRLEAVLAKGATHTARRDGLAISFVILASTKTSFDWDAWEHFDFGNWWHLKEMDGLSCDQESQVFWVPELQIWGFVSNLSLAMDTAECQLQNCIVLQSLLHVASFPLW